MAPLSKYTPLSEGYKLLNQMRRGGTLPTEIKNLLASRYDKTQAERHADSFAALYAVSENTALFLPNESGDYIRPPELELIDPARAVMGELNTKKKAYRRNTLFDVKTPECAHGLGVMNWALHCVGVKHISEQYLAYTLAKHQLTRPMITTLSIIRIGLSSYFHDGTEDNPLYEPKYFASGGARAILPDDVADIIAPVIASDIAALTDNPRLHGLERLESQKKPPQREYKTLKRMGIIDEHTVGTGPIGTIKYCDKTHTIVSDMLGAMLGKLEKDPVSFLLYVEPRIDIVSSLRVPDGYKNLCEESAERCYAALHKGPKHKYTPEEAGKVIHRELLRVRSILGGAPFTPADKKIFSSLSDRHIAPY